MIDSQNADLYAAIGVALACMSKHAEEPLVSGAAKVLHNFIREEERHHREAVAAPKLAPFQLTDQQRSAVSLFGCWWAMVEAEAELADAPIKDDAVILHFMGSGASCMVFAKDIRALCVVLSACEAGQ